MTSVSTAIKSAGETMTTVFVAYEREYRGHVFLTSHNVCALVDGGRQLTFMSHRHDQAVGFVDVAVRHVKQVPNGALLLTFLYFWSAT